MNKNYRATTSARKMSLMKNEGNHLYRTLKQKKLKVITSSRVSHWDSVLNDEPIF